MSAPAVETRPNRPVVWGEFTPPTPFVAVVTSKSRVRHSRALSCAG